MGILLHQWCRFRLMPVVVDMVRGPTGRIVVSLVVAVSRATRLTIPTTSL